MGWLIAISLLFAYLAIRSFFHIFICLKRHRFARAGGSCVSCLVTATIAGAASVLVLSYASYGRLVDEQLVSMIEFRRTAPNEFQARLMIPGQTDQFYLLRGDEWQMDAKIVTWQPPLTILGLEPIYRLDRLSGRYGEIDREMNEVRTVHELSANLPTDVWQIARRFPVLAPGIDAHYGTATFVPMADGARYDVSLSRDALIARPANERARDALGDWNLPGN
jgi:hypothetical protein